MTRAARSIWMGLLSLALSAATATAQDTPPVWEPVDQSVGDLDLRAASTRRIEQGLSVYGQSGTLYRRNDDGYLRFGPGESLNQQYQLRRPGYTAWIDQPEYLMSDPFGQTQRNVAPAIDGHFVNLIPPNAVFDLVPQSQKGLLPVYDAYTDPNQVDTRIDGFLGNAVTGDTAVQPLPPPPRAHRLPQHLIERRQQYIREQMEQADDRPDEVVQEAESTDSEQPDEQ